MGKYMRKRIPMAMMAEMLNLLRSAMSAWIVGKVDAPANANMIEPKAEGAELNDLDIKLL